MTSILKRKNLDTETCIGGRCEEIQGKASYLEEGMVRSLQLTTLTVPGKNQHCQHLDFRPLVLTTTEIVNVCRLSDTDCGSLSQHP